jgi:hypothetical protein
VFLSEEPKDLNYWVLGAQFLKAYVSIYDVTSKKIGLLPIFPGSATTQPTDTVIADIKKK